MGGKVKASGLVFAVTSIVIAYTVYNALGPEGSRMSSFIPSPPEDAPFLYLEHSAASAVLPVVGAAADVLAERGVPSDWVSLLTPMLDEAGETAALLTYSKFGVHLHLAARIRTGAGSPSANVLQELADSRQGDSPALVRTEDDEVFALTTESGGDGLFVCADRGVVMVSSTCDGLRRMGLALRKMLEPIEPPPSRGRTWPGRILLSDGGLISSLASIEGLPVEKERVTVSAAWRERAGGGEMRWIIDGLPEVFRGQLDSPLDEDLGANCEFPEPLVAAAGFILPETLFKTWKTSNAAVFLQERLGDSFNYLEELIPGPCVLSLCGTGKFLLFSIPGILLELPGRGVKGMEFADQFWTGYLGSQVPMVEKAPGYPSGGASSIPFSILAAANPGVLKLGLIEGEALKPGRTRPLCDYAGELEDVRGAFFWAFLDVEQALFAMRGLARTIKDAGKVVTGLESGSITRASRLLESLGTLTLVMPTPAGGRLEWLYTKPARH